jgi:chitinase
LECLRESLDAGGKKMHLSSAVGAGLNCVNDMEIEKIGKILDHVNVMTYDMRGFGGNAGHHTNLYPQTGDENGLCADKAINQYIEAGIPAQKIVLGSAFYGRTWEKTAGFNQPGEKNSSLMYTEIDRLLKSGYARHWDEKANAPYAFDGSTFITYDDEESLAAKCQYVQNKSLAGIMFWEYGGDDTRKLLHAIYKGMGKN